MPKMVCRNCQLEFKSEKNGVIVVETMNNDTKIYKLWGADLWKCPWCGYEVVAGFASRPLMEHYEGHIEEFLEKLKQDGRIVIYDKEKYDHKE